MREIHNIVEDGEVKAVLLGKEEGDREIFFDGAWGLSVSGGGSAKMNLYTVVSGEDAFERREVVARLVCEFRVLSQLRDFLVKHVAEIEKNLPKEK